MAQNFKNPFDFIMQEETIQLNAPAPSFIAKNPKKNHPAQFSPYEITEASQPIPLKEPMEGVVTFNPNANHEELEEPQYIDLRQTKEYTLDEYGDPPLLIDLGIDPDNIKQKLKLVLLLRKPGEETLSNPDLSGPIAVALFLGFLLLLSGKLHFGDIYGVSIIGTVIMYFLMNLMSERILIPVYNVMSVLGYALLPMCLLAAVSTFFQFTGVLGLICFFVCASWSAYSATLFFQQILHLHNKRWLIAYPAFLFYMTFVLITIL